MNLKDRIIKEMNTSSNYSSTQESRLQAIYKDASEKEKESIDEIFYILTGLSLGHYLQSQTEDILKSIKIVSDLVKNMKITNNTDIN